MNRDNAKEILKLYRPSAIAEPDSEMAAALVFARGDPDLKKWLEQHTRFQREMRAKLQSIEPPPGLQEKILAQLSPRLAEVPSLWTFWRAVAAAAVVTGIASWFLFLAPPKLERDVRSYRGRMVRYALREYRMDLINTDPVKVSRYLQQSTGLDHASLTPALERTRELGGAALRWQGQPVSLICFDRGGGNLLWYFIIDASAIRGAAPKSNPEFAQIGKMITATWQEGDKVYLLAAIGDKEALQKFL